MVQGIRRITANNTQNKMTKKMLYYTLPMFGVTFKGLAYNTTQLSAKFQIWARQYAITDEESLALWIAGDYDMKTYFKSEEECVAIATSAFPKLPAIITETIDLTEQ